MNVSLKNIRSRMTGGKLGQKQRIQNPKKEEEY